MKYYLGYDCGTMGTKVAIFSEDSTLVSVAYRPHRIDYPRPGWAEMDADQFYTLTSEGVRECLEKSGIDPHDIRAISCSGVICGIVPIDDTWNAVGPYIPYLDGRSRDIVKRVTETVEPIWKKESGNAVFGAYVPPMILKWLLEHERDLIKRARKVVAGAHYVMGKLGGLSADRAFIDWSHLSGWIIGFDVRKRGWSERQMELLGIPFEILPEVKRPWDVVGTLTREQADRLGLVEGDTPRRGGR